MNDTFFPTSTDEDATPVPPTPEAWAALQSENNRLNDDIERVRGLYASSSTSTQEYRQKIDNVKGYIRDIYSEDGEVDDRVKDIAGLLNIELTKSISGTAIFEISWTADVPLDFDPDDFEISFDVNCDTYEADNFDWDEENTSVSAEEE